MKKHYSLLAFSLLLGSLTGCGNKTSVSITYNGNEETIKFAINEIKDSLTRNGLKFKESGGTYNVTFEDLSDSLAKQAYSIDVNGKNITITGGDNVGLMYGGLQLAESINIEDGIANVKSISESPYIDFRGVSVRPPFDLRNPSYTNNGDSTRANMENTWDINYWKGLFDIMAKMRYNILSFATVNALPSMVKVPGYENCALNDVWQYNGTYDDTYLGNCTNMYREEHAQEGNYTVLKKMTIDEKITFWQDVMQAAHDRGITWQFSTMNIYTFSEESAGYGITDDKNNQTTKDYFRKGFKALLETYPYIEQIKTTCGENLEYKVEEEDIANQWYRDVYGGAVEDFLKEHPERADSFQLGFAGVGNTLLSDSFYSKFSDYPYNLYVNKRYNDTRLYSTNHCTDNNDYIKGMPDGWNMMYNVRGEDAYHYTWGDAEWVKEWCKNVKQDRVTGWHFAIDGYYVSGKEYEFKDESLNGDYYYNRHWINYSMFGRFGYNPNMEVSYWDKIVEDHYEGVKKDLVSRSWKVMNKAAKVMPLVICSYAPGGTDAAFLPEMCSSNPTLFGFLDIKRFINADSADPDGDIYSIAEYARMVKEGNTDLKKKTPFQVASELRSIAAEVKLEVDAIRVELKNENVALDNLLQDQLGFAHIANYYAEKFEGAMNLRLYNDSEDTTKRDLAVKNLEKALEVWNGYSDYYLARFKVERLPRHGVIDPSAFTTTVEKDIKTAKNWSPRSY